MYHAGERGKDAAKQPEVDLMTRWTLIALCAGATAFGFTPSALAQQETAEPPRVLTEENPEKPSAFEAIQTASSAVESAATYAPGAVLRNDAEPAPPHESDDSEGTSGDVETPAQPEDDSPLPTVEELVELGEQDAVEDVAEAVEELEAPPAEDLEVPETPEFDEENFQSTLQLLRRFQRSLDDGVQSIDRFAETLRDPLNAGMINLRPYVASEGWGEVVELLYDDHCKEAKKKATELAGAPDADTPPALQYFFARIQMCAGEEDEGRKKLEELADTETAVGILAARRLGQNVKVTEIADDAEGMYLSEKIRQAKRGAKKGDVDAALEALDALHDEMSRRWDRFKVRKAQAEVLEGAGRLDEAGKTYLAIYRKTRGWKVNESIEDEIERLERRTGKRILSYGERIDRMRHLISRGRYRQAKQVSVENAKIRGVGGKEIRGWMYYRQALQAEREKDRGKAANLFAKANKLVRDSEVRPRLYFGWARALRRLDRDSEAVDLYGKLCDEYPKQHLCDEATYEAGRLLQYAEKHDEAVEKFEDVVSNFPDSDYVPDALWRHALSRYLQGEYDAAITPLERLRRDFPDERDESELTLGLKATYWLGVAYLKKGDRANAERYLQQTVDRGTLTWYGRLAEARMRAEGWSPSVRIPDHRLTEAELEDLATLRVPRNPRLEVAAEYARLGLWREALAETKEQIAIHPVPEGAHRLLASIHLANGQPNWAHWIMKKHIDEAGPTHATLRDWGTAFPLNYMELAHRFGTEFNVSPFLVMAIIRQESGFRPKVRSWAGAIGLMQLMPRTASYTHRVFLDEKKRFRRRDLRTPEKNVKLGTMYIRIHTAHAADNVALALAGYNAGPAPLESWLERYGDRELDAWVESITYQEARGYVRKVFTSYITYSALYGGELPPISLEVPKKLRKWGDVPESGRVQPDEPVSLRDDR
jgi:soluble lytic murein transglycosylase-like protein